MPGWAKNGNLYPTSGVYGIDDTKTSLDTGWSSAKIEDRISKINIKHALKVDALPTYSDGTITYVKDGTTYTTTNAEQWFYYMDGTSLKQTIFIDGEETTIEGTGVVLDDYAEKVTVGELTDLATTDQSSIVNAINELTVNFQAGVDTLYDTCVDCGETPVDKTPTAIADAIRLLAASSNWWTTWLSLGGIDVSNYSSLDGVLADTTALDTLMKKHASVDYLINELSNNTGALNIIVNDENAMTYIGTYDYCSDMMLANSTLSAALLSSTYWQCILKDHVPTMTSNTTPEGTASESSSYTSTSTNVNLRAWYAFDGGANDSIPGVGWAAIATDTTPRISYHFTKPINIKRIWLKNSDNNAIKTFDLYGSNDNTNWAKIGDTFTSTNTTASGESYYDVDCEQYYTKYYLQVLTDTDDYSACGARIRGLNFFGRSLNVSVPTMTSNTTPEGEAICSDTRGSGFEAYKAFDGTSAYWNSPTSGSNYTLPHYIGYNFNKDVAVKKFTILNRTEESSGAGTYCPIDFELQGSNDGTSWSTIQVYKNTSTSSGATYRGTVSNPKGYKQYRLYITTSGSGLYHVANTIVIIDELQFYGVDYSE